MSITYADIVNEIEMSLAGYTQRQDRTTHLTDNITSTATTLKLASTTNIGKGIYQIDDELIWVDSYDRVSSTASVPPYGRGYNGTAKVEHLSGAKVVVAPTFPRATIKKAIADTLETIWPELYVFDTHEFTWNSAKNTYEIPEEVNTIQYVSWQNTGSTREWLPVRNWRQDPMANVGAFASGNTITIYDRNIIAGRKVQLHYTKKPGTFDTNMDADFVTTTGLPLSAKDVILYGAAYRLASFIDPGRLTYTSAEADQADTKIQYGSGASTARYLYNLYQTRLKEEADKLRDLYPARIHYTRY